MRIYRLSENENISPSRKKFHYLGQCDRLRCDNIGEDKWNRMIKSHVKVSQEEFENNCNVKEILDEGESLEEFIGADPTSYFAKSLWGSQLCYYIMTAGFEFIFV